MDSVVGPAPERVVVDEVPTICVAVAVAIEVDEAIEQQRQPARSEQFVVLRDSFVEAIVV